MKRLSLFSLFSFVAAFSLTACGSLKDILEKDNKKKDTTAAPATAPKQPDSNSPGTANSTVQDVAATVTQASLQGTWTRDCTKITSEDEDGKAYEGSIQQILVVTGDKFAISKKEFTDTKCTTLSYESSFSGVLVLGKQKSGVPGQELDMNTSAVTVIAVDQKFFDMVKNEPELKGIQKGVPKTIAKTQPNYTIVKVSGNTLFLGSDTEEEDGETVEKRHSKLSTAGYKK